METRLSELKSVVAEKDQKLSRAEDEIIKLTEKCAELMTKDLKSGMSIYMYRISSRFDELPAITC